MGLGALSMYHFTEVPTILSNNRFVIFDPTRRYLPKHKSRILGGRRIKLNDMEG